ncbi:hypothetical protein Hanom_Chr06g00558481 [Helianthus anomalus]
MPAPPSAAVATHRSSTSASPFSSPLPPFSSTCSSSSHTPPPSMADCLMPRLVRSCR